MVRMMAALSEVCLRTHRLWPLLCLLGISSSVCEIYPDSKLLHAFPGHHQSFCYSPRMVCHLLFRHLLPVNSVIVLSSAKRRAQYCTACAPPVLITSYLLFRWQKKRTDPQDPFLVFSYRRGLRVRPSPTQMSSRTIDFTIFSTCSI